MNAVRSRLWKCKPYNLRSGLLKFAGAIIALLIVIYMCFSPTWFSFRFSISLPGELQEAVGASSKQERSSITLDSKTYVHNTTSPKNNNTTHSSQQETTTFNSIDTGPLYLTTIFQSRLGNHLFIYASLLGLARAQNRIPFIHSGSHLDNVFQITHVNDNISAEGFRLMRHTTFGVVYPSLWSLPRENITLHGPREVFRYFENIEDEVRREFTFCVPLQRQINETLGKVRAEFKGHVIVGVHARRGDFLEDGNKKIGFGVPKVSYFINAFRRMRSMLNGRKVTFLMASDDLQWCHENLNFTDVKILEPGSAELHFGVLANCDHVILSSGTYGWWAAWLADGISIYYDGYFVNGSVLRSQVNLPDYYPPGWIAVGD